MKNSVDSTAAYLSQFEKIGTETAELFRNKKWEETPLGPISGWSETLKSAASICLQCKSPVLVMWGSDFTQIYNDAFSLIMDANRHPNLYGTNAAKCWYDIWPHSGPILETVLVTGKAFENEDLCMFLVNKQGKEEERYFTFTYNPLFDNTKSTIEGIFAIIIETTDKIISQRRLNLLRELSSHSTEATNAKDACYMLLRAIGTGSVDIPFASIYSVEYSQSTTRLKLVDTVGGIEKGTPYTPLSLSTDIDITKYSNKEKDFLLALLRVVKTGTPETFDLSDYDLPKCPWGRVPTSCVISAICSSQGKPVGLLIAGLSPVLNFNENYQSFFSLLAGQAGTILANARAHEEERKRLEMMAEIDRAKTNFFSNISHEFRTPLTLMLGPLEELLNNENAVNMDFKEHVSLVHRNALRLLKLVNNLLEVSRIEAGRVQVNYEPTNLQELTKDLASVFHSAMEKAGLEYIVNCETITEPVYVDREMWEKIVMNLLSNAFKFTLTGSIFVTQKQISSNNVQLTIEDTGVGIPEEDIPKLFERFYRVHESKGRSWEGTGIGLAMVSELVKLQEGTIQVKSKLEKGTTITVIIPIRGNKAQGITGEKEKKIQLTNSPKYTRTTGWWVPEMTTNISNLNLNEKTRQQILENMNFTEENERPNILIVDDNADMREYLTKLLKFNYNVLTACDGIEALEVVQKKIPSLILTDIMMPRLDGVGLLHKIRENPKTQVVPVILLSARAGEEAQVEGLQQGADDYLIKPFSSNELLARVKTHLNLYKVRMEARQAEIATRAKDHFLAVLSHELRTPLTPVLLLVSELEQNKELSKQIKEDIQLIARNIKLEVRLIDDLLDITRIINNKLSLNLCPTNAQEEIEHTIELVKSEAKTKSIQLIIHFNAKKNIILADPSRLQQVFWNLIKNSIKFSSIGGNVTIITDNFTPNTFDLKVIDQGIGIEKDQLEKIFDTFQQANPNIEHQFGGLGLGLSISKALVQLMKGTIIAYSEGPGTGATFTVTLPLVNQKVPMKFPIKTDISKSRVLPKKILLIEDNKSTALVMNRFLQRLGHNVKLATCVKEALTIAKQDSFELVISDIGLPDGNGFDLMKQLNQLYNNKLKAICVTGYGMKDDLKKSQESGFAVHLVKPIEFSSLEEAISEVYKGEIK